MGLSPGNVQKVQRFIFIYVSLIYTHLIYLYLLLISSLYHIPVGIYQCVHMYAYVCMMSMYMYFCANVCRHNMYNVYRHKYLNVKVLL